MVSDVLGEGGSSRFRGFILRNDNFNNYKQLHSSNNPSQKPFMEVQWSEDTTVAPGIYFMRNIQRDYLDANPSSGNVIRWEFHGGSNQQWRVVDVGGGYYKLQTITPNYYNYALDVSMASDVDGTNVLVWHDVGTNNQKWRIISNNDSAGSYRLMPAISSTRCLDAYSSGSNVELYSYWGGSNQKWVFEPTSFYATIKNYYDNGYVARYGGSGSNSPANKIAQWQGYVSAVFKSAFNLNISVTTPQLFTSVADTCPHDSATNSYNSFCNSINQGGTCNLSTSLPQHCKNVYKLLNSAPMGETLKPVKYVRWTGHLTCSGGTVGSSFNIYDPYDRSRHAGLTGLGGANSLILYGNLPGGRDANSSLVLMHELGHAFGAIGDDAHDTICVMSTGGDTLTKYNKIVSNDPNVFCSRCKTQIRNYLISHGYWKETT